MKKMSYMKNSVISCTFSLICFSHIFSCVLSRFERNYFCSMLEFSDTKKYCKKAKNINNELWISIVPLRDWNKRVRKSKIQMCMIFRIYCCIHVWIVLIKNKHKVPLPWSVEAAIIFLRWHSIYTQLHVCKWLSGSVQMS